MSFKGFFFLNISCVDATNNAQRDRARSGEAS